MNNILDIKSPAEGQAAARKSDFGLENHGLIKPEQGILEPAHRSALRRSDFPQRGQDHSRWTFCGQYRETHCPGSQRQICRARSQH